MVTITPLTIGVNAFKAGVTQHRSFVIPISPEINCRSILLIPEEPNFQPFYTQASGVVAEMVKTHVVDCCHVTMARKSRFPAFLYPKCSTHA